MLRIPITMCHGLRPDDKELPLSYELFETLVRMAHKMGFTSINYDHLDRWYKTGDGLPERPIMFDFDHPVLSIREGVHEILARYGFGGTLFVNTGPLVDEWPPGKKEESDEVFMSWEQLRSLIPDGWLIGAHTVTHPNLSELSVQDPTGQTIRRELERCDAMLKEHLGVTARDFAFTGTSWSSQAEKVVKERYRFGRLWIYNSTFYQVDGKKTRYAELVGVQGDDEADGGPPNAARYITRQCDRYRLPSMEIQGLVHKPEAFERYLQGALDG